MAFSVVIFAISSKGMLKILPNFSATSRVLPGSLTLPLKGTGLRNGESVSTKIRSRGNSLATKGNELFLNVKFPEKEM